MPLFPSRGDSAHKKMLWLEGWRWILSGTVLPQASWFPTAQHCLYPQTHFCLCKCPDFSI